MEYLRATGSPADVALTDAVRASDEIGVPDVVRLELLAGAGTDEQVRDLQRLLARFSALPCGPTPRCWRGTGVVLAQLEPRLPGHDARVTALRALVFDVFGTVVDWRSGVLAEAGAVSARTGVQADWAAVVDDWRRAYQPSLLEARRASAWRDLDALHRESLRTVLARHGLVLPAVEHDALVRSWRRLPAWPDARPGLERLRGRYVTATLSNGHVALLVDLVRFADLRFDAVLSAQLAASYKPDPVVYAKAAELLGLAPQQVGMVAAHGSDLAAAAEVGLRPLFVRRPREWGPAGGDEPPHGLPGLVVAASLDDLADQLNT